MKKANEYIAPLAGCLALILLYLVPLCFRGIVSLQEYEFAVMLRKIVPGISGTYLPKLPAALATLLTAVLIWTTAMRMKLLHPCTAPVLFLCFPPVWWFGTSVSPVPLLVLLITFAVSGLFAARKEKNFILKIVGVAVGVIAALAAAFFVQSQLFSWAAVIMSPVPVICLAISIRLEKLDDRDLAAKKFNHWAIAFAVALLSILAILLVPQFCNIFKINIPDKLAAFYSGKSILRPALALLIPLFWLYLVKDAKKSFDKFSLIEVAMGFFLLVMPSTLPWRKISGTLQPSHLKQVSKELMKNNPVIFADNSTAIVLSYCLGRPVTLVSWTPGYLHPSQLKEKITAAQQFGDVIVASDNGELEQFLPNCRMIKYTLSPNCKLYLFPGEKK